MCSSCGNGTNPIKTELTQEFEEYIKRIHAIETMLPPHQLSKFRAKPFNQKRYIVDVLKRTGVMF